MVGKKRPKISRNNQEEEWRTDIDQLQSTDTENAFEELYFLERNISNQRSRWQPVVTGHRVNQIRQLTVPEEYCLLTLSTFEDIVIVVRLLQKDDAHPIPVTNFRFSLEIQFAPIIRGESLYFNEFLRQLSRAFLEIYEGIRLQTINAADYYAIFSVRHPEAEIAFSSQPRMLTEENGLFTIAEIIAALQGEC